MFKRFAAATATIAMLALFAGGPTNATQGGMWLANHFNMSPEEGAFTAGACGAIGWLAGAAAGSALGGPVGGVIGTVLGAGAGAA